MSKIYELTAQIYSELERVQEKTGIKIEIESDYFWTKYKYKNKNKIVDKIELLNNSQYNKELNKDNFPAIQGTQVRQILVALQDILGSGLDYNDFDDIQSFEGCSPQDDIAEKHIPKTRAKELDICWFSLREIDGRVEPSLFDTNPEQVLEELLEILKSI